MLPKSVISKIEYEAGYSIRYPKDCEILSKQIEDKTGRAISSSTLKRMFGLVKDKRQPHKYSLDTIAIFIGLSDWDAIETGNKSDSVNSTESKKTVSRRTLIWILSATILIVLIIFMMNQNGSINGETDDKNVSWSYLPVLPEGRSGGAVVSKNEKLYYVGGADAAFVRSNLYVFDALIKTWDTLTPLPISIGESGVSAYDGDIYSFGGWDGEKESSRSFMYSIAKDEWTEIEPLPVPLTSVHAVAVDTSIYILGGTLGSTNTFFFRFDIKSQVYHQLNTFSTSRNYAQLVVYDNHIYAIGGHLFMKGQYTVTNNLDMYSISDNRWIPKSSMPVALSRGSAIVYNDEIHYLGGNSSIGDHRVGNTSEHLIYYIQSNSWGHGEDIPSKLSSLDCVILNDTIICVGGNTTSPNPSDQVIQIPLN